MQKTQKLSDKLTSRKFWLVLLILLGSTGLFWIGKITAENWSDITKTTLMVYVGGNALNSLGYNFSQSYYNHNNTEGRDV
ncbi:MAG: hypothetical protein PHN44_10845 [Candidatus Marinimicrobia bacterium]|jgi:uncharacterized membrane protein|nr:hypothetical protein [Candidatus Neomarinimicrobiota bacterium]